MENYGTENTMVFNMQEVGARILQLRRDQDLTQAELAECLGISYQAVSSWERGASMPDISKLVDLARMLHTSVDRLLGNENEEAAEKAEVTALAPEVLAHAKWAVEHAGDAPKAKKIGMKTLLGLAPFLPSEDLEKLAMEAYDEADYGMIPGRAPF